MKKIFLLTGGLVLMNWVSAQQPSRAAAIASTAMKLWKDSFLLEGDKTAKWRYDQGVILKGFEDLWLASGDVKWFNYIQKSMDFYLNEEGQIRGYKLSDYNLDNINNGKSLLLLYRVTGKEKYRRAAQQLREQLKTQPRNSEGGFWHKKVYPSQMWLDGLYMAQPFYAEYAWLFHEDTAFNDIARQFRIMEEHARDRSSGLLFHGWDESKQQKWANPRTGLSPEVWGRAMGWYGMALVDALDYFPNTHPRRQQLIEILNRFATAVVKVQDAKSGLWYDLPAKGGQPKNYYEASASSMFVYTLAKSVRKGYLPSKFLSSATKGYKGLVSQFVKLEDGQTNLSGTVSVSGLGGNPYRDGSFAYYMSEPVVVNDPKGMGAFIGAANEMERLDGPKPGKGKTVLLDYFFNNETKKDVTGTNVRWHYTWDDKSNGGFTMWGAIFEREGAKLAFLDKAPDAQSLKNASVYIIVDPDTEKETATPQFMSDAYASQIATWVANGGTLILMTNDKGNADLQHSNLLAEKFGVHFNEDNFNMVLKDTFEQGKVMVDTPNPVFRTAKNLFIKELSTLEIKPPAKPVLQKQGTIVAAVAKHGKGKVFIIGDPWLYNEYVDGRKLPPVYDNYQAAKDLATWSLTKN